MESALINVVFQYDSVYFLLGTKISFMDVVQKFSITTTLVNVHDSEAVELAISECTKVFITLR